MKEGRERQTLTAQDSHVEPGVDVGQLVLRGHISGLASVCAETSISSKKKKRKDERALRLTYVEHGRVPAELHQVLAQFALVLVQHVLEKKKKTMKMNRKEPDQSGHVTKAG